MRGEDEMLHHCKTSKIKRLIHQIRQAEQEALESRKIIWSKTNKSFFSSQAVNPI